MSAIVVGGAAVGYAVGGTVAAAAVGATVGSAISSSGAAGDAADAQNRATAAAEDASQAQLQFERERYDDWKDVFGDTQTQLGEYYENLSGEAIEAMGIQHIEQEYNVAKKALDRTLAQRGLSTSGAAVQGHTQLETAKAMGKADVRASSEYEAMQKKQSFLGVGLGLESSAAAGVSGALSSQAATQYGLAEQYGDLSQQAAAGVGQAIGGGINTYMQYQNMQNMNNALMQFTQGT